MATMVQASWISRISLFLFVLALHFSTGSATTDPRDDKVLRSMYLNLGLPPHLSGWSLKGGDPCGSPSWQGVSCCGSRVKSIDLKGLEVGGFLTGLGNLTSLKSFDVSNNNIAGFIPLSLPPNVTYLDLSNNNLVGNLPNSLPDLKKIKYLNISNNLLIGPLAHRFKDMQNLEKLDLSVNHLIGDLPHYFADLTNLHELHVQRNKFKGDVKCLADLPLSVLNLENNRFTGCVPDRLKSIPELRTDGNNFDHCGPVTEAPTPESSPPEPSTPDSNVADSENNNTPNNDNSHKKKVNRPLVIGIGIGVAIVLLLVVVVIAILCCCRSDEK